jgi:hypothetical protein
MVRGEGLDSPERTLLLAIGAGGTARRLAFASPYGHIFFMEKESSCNLTLGLVMIVAFITFAVLGKPKKTSGAQGR